MSRLVTPRGPSTGGRKPRGRFLHEVVLELRKVKWPSLEDVWQLTLVVLSSCILVAAYVAVLDFVFGKVFQLIGMYGR